MFCDNSGSLFGVITGVFSLECGASCFPRNSTESEYFTQNNNGQKNHRKMFQGDYMKSVQIWSFFLSVFSRIWTLFILWNGYDCHMIITI